MRSEAPVVVVAEDDPDILTLVELRLRLLGCVVVTAVDGDAALAAITSNTPDLAVLDIQMPGLDGLGVVDRVRANAETSDVPIILLSASVHEADVRRGLARGADAYVKKPFEARELATAVETILARQPMRLAS
jgi:two-component system phosphate regulon response regulator PhoB